jgi:hypothetical protein
VVRHQLRKPSLRCTREGVGRWRCALRLARVYRSRQVAKGEGDWVFQGKKPGPTPPDHHAPASRGLQVGGALLEGEARPYVPAFGGDGAPGERGRPGADRA